MRRKTSTFVFVFGTEITPDKQVLIKKDVGLMSQSYVKYSDLTSRYPTYTGRHQSDLTHYRTAPLFSDEYCAIA